MLWNVVSMRREEGGGRRGLTLISCKHIPCAHQQHAQRARRAHELRTQEVSLHDAALLTCAHLLVFATSLLALKPYNETVAERRNSKTFKMKQSSPANFLSSPTSR